MICVPTENCKLKVSIRLKLAFTFASLAIQNVSSVDSDLTARMHFSLEAISVIPRRSYTAITSTFYDVVLASNFAYHFIGIYQFNNYLF